MLVIAPNSLLQRKMLDVVRRTFDYRGSKVHWKSKKVWDSRWSQLQHFLKKCMQSSSSCTNASTFWNASTTGSLVQRSVHSRVSKNLAHGAEKREMESECLPETKVPRTLISRPQNPRKEHPSARNFIPFLYFIYRGFSANEYGQRPSSLMQIQIWVQ